MSSKFRRARALLQSFDTARFVDDDNKDKSADIAQARCEVLSALLFGNEIVIPAGAVAESPAFHDLFSEVMIPGEKAITKLNDFTDIPYQPFRIGLEPRYRNYDDFVKSYLKENFLDSVPYVKLGELAQKSNDHEITKGFPLFAGEAYLRKDWTKLKKVDKRYTKHAKLVDKYFGKKSHFQPIYSNGMTFSGREPDSIMNSLIEYLRLAKLAEINFSEYDGIEKMIKEMFKSIKNTQQRGIWYKHREHFGEHWEFIRTWLDFDLFELMRSTYNVQLPSYFTQEIYDYDIIKKLVLIPTGRENHMNYFSRKPEQNQSFSILTDKIEWPMVWDSISRKEVIESTNRYQKDLAIALKMPVNKETIEARASLIRAATESHVLTLNTFLPNLTFEMDKKNSKLKVRVQQESNLKQKILTATGVVGGTLLGAALGSPFEGLIASTIIGTSASYGFELALKNRVANINLIKREKNMINLRKQSKATLNYVDKEVERVNFWISVD